MAVGRQQDGRSLSTGVVPSTASAVPANVRQVRCQLMYGLPGMTASMICLTPGAVTIMPTMGRPASLGMSIRACGGEQVY